MVAFVWDLAVSCQRDEITVLAAALAHFALLSLVPLLMLAATVLGIIFRHNLDATREAQRIITEFIPNPAAINRIFGRLVATRGTIGGYGLAILVWLCGRSFAVLQRALDTVFGIVGTARRRAFHWRWLQTLWTMGGLGALAYVSMWVSVREHWPLLGEVSDAMPSAVRGGLGSVLTFLGGAAFSVALMWLIYHLLPSARVRPGSALFGAVFAGLIWELGKLSFSIYVQRYADIDRFYGTMGGLVLVIVWSYLSALIVLVGAEMAKCHALWFADGAILSPEAPPSASARAWRRGRAWWELRRRRRPTAEKKHERHDSG